MFREALLITATLTLGCSLTFGQQLAPSGTPKLIPPTIAIAADIPGSGKHGPTLANAQMASNNRVSGDRFAASITPASATVLPTTEPKLSLHRLIDLALAHNPAVAQAAAIYQAASGRQYQAGRMPNPEVSYLGVEMGQDNLSGQQGAGISQTFPFFGKRKLEKRIATYDVVLARHNLTAQRLRVITDVTAAYYGVLVARETQETAQQIYELDQQAIEALQRLTAAQEASRLQLLQAQLHAEDSRMQLISAQKELEAALQRLASVVGVSDLQIEQLSAVKLDVPDELSWEETLGRLQEESPELQIARTLVKQAQCRVLLERRNVWPDVDVAFAVQHDNSSRCNFASVEITFPVPLFNRNWGNIRAAEAELVAASKEVERKQLDLQKRLAEAIAQYNSTIEQCRLYRDSVLPKQQELVELLEAAHKRGEVDFFDYWQAQTSAHAARLEYLQLLGQAYGQRARIEGLLLEDSLGEDPLID